MIPYLHSHPQLLWGQQFPP